MDSVCGWIAVSFKQKQRFYVAALCLGLAIMLIAAIIMESTITYGFACPNYCVQGNPCPPCLASQTIFHIDFSSPVILIQLVVVIVLIVSAIAMFL